MRSRYSAYVCGDVDYLVRTTLPEQQLELDRSAMLAWSQSATWLGLKVLAGEAGSANDEEGYVEFRAEFEQNGARQAHRERSHFLQRDGSWYFDYRLTVTVSDEGSKPTAHTGRNEPCPCGSGKKYKKCCGR